MEPDLDFEAVQASIDAARKASIDRFVSGSDEPVETETFEDEDYGDLTAPATPPHAITLSSEDIPEGESDLIDLLGDDDLTAPAPPPVKRIAKERKDRVTAFADRIAEDRARALLGDEFEGIVAGMSAAPKKVADKVYNVLCCVADRGKLSRYTHIALDTLAGKRVVSSADLQAAYIDAGYTEATARSQAHQQMVALPILGVAKKEDGLIPIMDSAIWKLLDGREQPPAPPKPEPVSDEELLAASSDEEPEGIPGGVDEAELSDDELLSELLTGE